ncbi:hypothetical protein DB345_02440 [Spartobacteria bacterium LR76]|nr:hypothetical protein DB345_02440 [Spartobacteria bacterium LR76]
MHFLLLPILLLLAWMPSSKLGKQVDLRSTLFSTYPQLAHPAAPSRYFRYAGSITENFRLDLAQPDFAAILSSAETIEPPPAGEGYVEVVTISDREYFILQHYPATSALPDPGVTAYRILPGRVEKVYTFGKSQRLTFTQIGASMWCYDYDEMGRTHRATTWCTMFDRQAARQQAAREFAASYADAVATRLLRRPSPPFTMVDVEPLTEEIYDYWPATGNLRTITSQSRWGNLPIHIRHFDESGNELKQQP